MTLDRGESVALVGGSGSGKSTLGRLIARLILPDAGTMFLDGLLIRAGRRPTRHERRLVQMVFQDPFGSLNPARTVADQVMRPLVIHGLHRGHERQRASELLEQVGLSPGSEFLDRFPHSLSGGQRQRVAIARALAPEPSLLIADEPTSMLDVSIRLDVLRTLRDLTEHKVGLLLITHDLASARYLADRVMVMQEGSIVEQGPIGQVIDAPQHPYTQQLLAAVAHQSPRRTQMERPHA